MKYTMNILGPPDMLVIKLVFFFQISFCKMVRGRKGGLAKVDDYIEISFSGDETYAECVHKAVHSLACEWEDEDGYDVPQICRVSGTRVLDQPLLINDEECPWTIATYVKHTFHKQTQVKLGIGMFEVCILVA